MNIKSAICEFYGYLRGQGLSKIAAARLAVAAGKCMCSTTTTTNERGYDEIIRLASKGNLKQGEVLHA